MFEGRQKRFTFDNDHLCRLGILGAGVSFAGHDVAGRRSVATDSAGRFRIEDLEAGRYRLGVNHRRESLIHNEDVELASDRDLVVEIAAAGITGRVISAATSEPLADVLVSLKQLLGTHGAAEGSLFTVSTDAQGFFRQLRLPAGRFRMSLRANGYEGTERILELAPGSRSEVPEISLVPTEGLDLVVRLASGAAPRFVHLRAVQGSDHFAVRGSPRPGWPATTVPSAWRPCRRAPGASW